ncbi:MAG: RDD family protein [Cellvibrionales bacterium]|nr:RDD family protein [Cellvibrionales bacterium]
MKNFKTHENPPFFRRFFAMIYDTFLVAAILIASMAVMVGLRMSIGMPLSENEVAISGGWRLPSLAFCLVNVSLFFAYFWVKNGQTLGMQAWRLAILNPQGDTITFPSAYIRLLASLLSAGLLGLGFLWAMVDKKKQTLHDYLSNTQTVLLPKKAK